MSESVTLADICAEIVDCEHKTAPQAAGGTEFGYSIGTPNIRKGRMLLDTAKRVDRATYVSWTVRGVPQRNDIILTREAPVGEAAFVDGLHPVCLGQRTVLLRADSSKVVPRYLHYLLLGPALQSLMHAKAEGSTVPHLNVGEIRALPVGILPSIPIQRAIAEVLGVLDDKIAVNERIANTVDVLSMMLYQADFEPARGIEDGWREGTLADICSTQYGYTASADPEASGPKFLRVTDMNKKNWIDWSSVPRCLDPGETKARYALVSGDIVVARMADPGKAAIVEEEVDAVFASYLVRLKTPSLAHSYYVFGFLKSDAYLDYAQGARSGSVQANMNAKTIIAAKIPIPPIELMESHLARVLQLRQKIAKTMQESLALAQLRDALLPGLMSGAIRVRDAEKAMEEAT